MKGFLWDLCSIILTALRFACSSCPLSLTYTPCLASSRSRSHQPSMIHSYLRFLAPNYLNMSLCRSPRLLLNTIHTCFNLFIVMKSFQKCMPNHSQPTIERIALLMRCKQQHMICYVQRYIVPQCERGTRTFDCYQWNCWWYSSAIYKIQRICKLPCSKQLLRSKFLFSFKCS